MMKMIKLCSVFFFSVAILTACEEQNEVANGTGRAKIYLTDAPVDDSRISAVVIAVSRVEAKGPEGWETVGEFEEPLAIDLLSYQNGDAFLLAEEEITAGTYTEVRLILNIQEEGADNAEGGSHIEFVDGSTEPLFVPSGIRSGYKVKGDFVIPRSGEADMTLDFDVRKAIVNAGDKFLLKPTLRLVANQEAGTIEGTFTNASGYSKVVVFAYTEGTFEESETTAPAEGDVRFSNAVTSSVVVDEEFTLAFMEAGQYDLYFAAFDENGGFVELLGTHQDVKVEADMSVELDLNVDLLD